MTVININNISGIASVNAQSNSLELFDNTGASLLDLNANTATFPGGISVGGTVTYDDVTNIDSVGIITAQSGIHVTGGNVGIGTDSPTEILHVFGGNFLKENNQTGSIILRSNQNNNINCSTLVFERNRGGATGTASTILDGDKLGEIDFKGYHGSYQTGARIRCVQAADVGIGTIVGKLNFFTRDAGGSLNLTAVFNEDRGAEFRGDIEIADKIYHRGDIDTAIRFPANNTFTVETAGSERFRISSEGIITKPYQVAFFAYCNITNHDLTPGDKFQFNSIPTNEPTAFNTNHTTYNGTNVFDTTNNRFTAPVAGLYHFTVTAFFNRDSDPYTAIVPYVNNSVVRNGTNDVFFFSNDDVFASQALSGSVTLQLAANDYVSVHRRSSSQSGTTRFYGPHSHFCGHLIG